MSTLHIISLGSTDIEQWATAMATVQDNDRVICIGDAIYALSNAKVIALLEGYKSQVSVFAEDAISRGIDLGNNYTTASIKEFVDMTFAAKKTLSWY